MVGFKPTHGLISRRGVLTLSRTLDHVGLFARSIDDVALLAEQIVGYDERDPDTRDYQRAIAGIGPIHESFVELFEQRYDAVLTPAATG